MGRWQVAGGAGGVSAAGGHGLRSVRRGLGGTAAGRQEQQQHLQQQEREGSDGERVLGFGDRGLRGCGSRGAAVRSRSPRDSSSYVSVDGVVGAVGTVALQDEQRGIAALQIACTGGEGEGGSSGARLWGPS
ncbi:hypothetical protein PLESTB_001086100 [Pleodorina starrii]|uniref:Uncharacterized protein n=1 Tax=Pleodorina starrii TaxID=330485 RepID=A0A9W6F589_9CHLO|nr:hypothetical protein PLESTB_001086100 [Pleodorina starrii]GLC70329.1 hypothetical protein PLESTF_000960200 [Pleodorina starrii]